MRIVVLILLVMFTALAWIELPDRGVGQQIILAIVLVIIFSAPVALGYRNARRRQTRKSRLLSRSDHQ